MPSPTIGTVIEPANWSEAVTATLIGWPRIRAVFDTFYGAEAMRTCIGHGSVTQSAALLGGTPTAAHWVRWAGAAGMVGGTLWIVSTVIHATKPVGCVADECAIRPMRESSAVEGILTLVALMLFTLMAVALIVLVRRAGRFGKAGRAGGVLGIVGISTLVVASLVQALLYEGDFQLMPYFVIPGIAALVIGLLLLGVSVLRSGVLPPWASIALLAGTAAMIGFNEQTHAAWLGLPFGLAWMAVGYALWNSSIDTAANATAQRVDA